MSSFATYLIANMETNTIPSPKIILSLRHVSGFMLLPCLSQRPLASLDCSGPAKSDGYFAPLDNDRDITRTFRELQHLRQRLWIVLDIEVGERDVPLGVVLPGRRGVRSGILPVDNDRRLHLPPPLLRCCLISVR